MSVDFGSVIDLQQSGTDQLVGSQIILPNTPSFSACGTPGVVGAPSNIAFNQELYDIGGNYDPSNGRYTAPVSGVYYFFAYFLAESASAGEYRQALMKNGAVPTGYHYIQTKGTDGYWTMICGGHMQMAAGDYAAMYRETGLGSHNNGAYYGFGGYLVA
jgi:hypothetical protein